MLKMNGVITLMLIKVEGALRRIEDERVRCAMSRMKIGKASEPSGAVIELFKAGGDKCYKHI